MCRKRPIENPDSSPPHIPCLSEAPKESLSQTQPTGLMLPGSNGILTMKCSWNLTRWRGPSVSWPKVVGTKLCNQQQPYSVGDCCILELRLL